MSAFRIHPKKWLDDLLDFESEWIECTPALSPTGFDPGDEVVTGLAKVAGKKTGIIAHNNLCNDGYITSRGAQKILKTMDLCEETGAPIVSLMSSPGVAIKEGLLAGDGYAKILRRTCELSGLVPQITGIMGVCVGGPAYSAVLQDIVVFNRLRSHIMVSASNVVKSVLGEESSLADLGGAKLHAESTGLAHFVEDNVKAQISRIRNLVGFFPTHYLQQPGKTKSISPDSTFDLPNDKTASYPMMKLVHSLLDSNEMHEYGRQYGQSVVTVWGYLDGNPVGIVANNPEHFAGSLNVESSEKSARFIRICDAYNLPIVTLVDTPGFMPGASEERRGLLKSGARLCRAMQTKVPRISVVLRKNYGAAAIVLTQTPSWGGDLVLALENSSCAIMGFKSAQQAIYGLQDFSSESLAKIEESYQAEYEDPKKAYRLGFVDQIVPYKELRSTLSLQLKILENKRDKKQSPVKGIEP